MIPYIARWDLDKTYLRTEFATLRDLIRTAFERPEQKRTVPGAATLMREIASVGASIHILSGSPEQLRARLEEKLRLDGATWDTFTLKPNLRNLLHLRFRAMRDQLGYKVPALLGARATLRPARSANGALVKEILLGDDAESDALVYSLYADVLAGRVTDLELENLLVRAHTYKDAIADAVRWARLVERGPVVERILIHLDRQSPPSEFALYGSRVVPFFNYLQAAFVLVEGGHLPPAAIVRVAVDLVLDHHFDGESLGRSYLDLWRRGHLQRPAAQAVEAAFRELSAMVPLPRGREIERMLSRMHEVEGSIRPGIVAIASLDYGRLVARHGSRRRSVD